jgi:hypothetical protein
MHAGYAEERNIVFSKLTRRSNGFDMNKIIERTEGNVNLWKLRVYQAWCEMTAHGTTKL